MLNTTNTLSLEELWKAALAEIELDLSKASFITWFKYTRILKEKDGGVIVIGVPNGFSKEWLESKYNKLILRSLRNLNKNIKEIEIEISNNEPVAQSLKTRGEAAQSQLGLPDIKIDKNTNLNKKYTFNSFVVGSSNELAYAASLAIAKNLGKTYNPLLVYGGVGLGKTHLLQAVGNEVAIKYPNKKIKYLSSEKFTNEFIESVKNKEMRDFKDKYRKVDVLIIDDIQFLANKEQTQEEFFHTFNTLYENNKQIILSSDQPPKSITTIDERLRSRFEGGMIADIGFPDYETRSAILRSKLDELSQELSEEIIDYIAVNITRNIRELEGALNKVLAIYEIEKNISQTKLSKILSEFFITQQKITTPAKIMDVVTKFYNIKINDLLTRSRKKNLVKPRQIAMFLLREELNYSYPNIGEKLGGRDHTTAIHACEKINNEMNENEEFIKEVKLIKERLYA